MKAKKESCDETQVTQDDCDPASFVIVKMEAASRESSPVSEEDKVLHLDVEDAQNQNINSTGWPCIYCLQIFQNELEHAIHKKTTHSDKKYVCETCQKKFTNKDNLKYHQRTHTGEKPFQCNECHKSFARNSALKVHKRIHAGEKPYNCKFCDKSFRHAHSLKHHTLIHTGKLYSCNYCKKSFVERRMLKRHTSVHTGDKDKPYSCNVCEKRFACNRTCNRHKLVHTRMKTFTCGQCKKTHTSRSELCKHKKLYHKVHPCDICKDMFDNKTMLRSHKLIHLTCKICKKRFRTLEKLEQHISSHGKTEID